MTSKKKSRRPQTKTRTRALTVDSRPRKYADEVPYDHGNDVCPPHEGTEYTHHRGAAKPLLHPGTCAQPTAHANGCHGFPTKRPKTIGFSGTSVSSVLG